MLSESRAGQVSEACQRLVRAKSYSGEEQQAADASRQLMLELGFDRVDIDRYGSVIGCIKGKRPGKKILLDGHIDTVPVPDASKWRYDPFGGRIEDGRIYGRGTSDMKGAVGAMICAAGYFAGDCGRDFGGEIYVAGTVQEECFEGIAAREISKAYKPDYVVIGEATALNLKRGQRGRAEIVLETFGRPAHSANPEEGRNAVYYMTALIEEIKRMGYEGHRFLGKGILVLTDIMSSPYPGASVVPDYCRATFDRRLLMGEGRESVLKPLTDIIERARNNIHGLEAKASYASGAETCYTGEPIEAERFFPAWLYEEEDELVQKALRGLKNSRLNPYVTHYSFCTNGSHYAGEAGIRTVGFGPSREDLAHTIDEYIEIDQLTAACEGYYGIIGAVL